MWNHITNMLEGLYGSKAEGYAITNKLTFRWCVIIILGLMLRVRKGGISSLQRSLHIAESHYSCMDDFFRSDAINLSALQDYWFDTIVDEMTPYEVDNKYVYTADGVLTPKEGRRMPGVSRHHKESGTQTKPSSFFGIHVGSIGLLTQGKGDALYSTPLVMELMDGIAPTATWANSTHPNANYTLEMQEIKRTFEITNYLKHHGIYLTDRASMCRNVYKEVDAQNDQCTYQLTMITPAARNCAAYKLPVIVPGKRGRRPIKGDEVKIADWVASEDGWKEATVTVYGDKRTIRYKTEVLLWGEGLYKKLRFVAVDIGGGSPIFVLTCTDIDMSAVTIIELYCKRFLCEEGFKQYKTVFHGFDMHFWSKDHPWNSFVAPKGTPHVLENVTDPVAQGHILKTISAMEVYFQLALMAQGIAQKIASEQEIGGYVHTYTTKRSRNAIKVSEEDVCNFLADHFDLLLDKYTTDSIIQFLQSKQVEEDVDKAYAVL